VFLRLKPLTRVHQQLKLRYWREQPFDLLGLPPEIRLMIYRYTLPKDRIFYMTARKHRFCARPPPEELTDEIIAQPLHLLCVCRLVHQELLPLFYHQCIFYITIYSIGDLLYAMDLLNRYGASDKTLRPIDIFSRISNIRIRVNDLVLDISPLHHGWCGVMIAQLSQTTQLWSGPGARTLLKNRPQAAWTVRMEQGQEMISDRFGAGILKDIILHKMSNIHGLDRASLNKVLPWWYYRSKRQHRHQLSTSPF
jgi:hypothetical protein